MRENGTRPQDWATRVHMKDRSARPHLRKTRAGQALTGEMAVKHIDAVLKETTLRQALHSWLYRTPIQGSVPTEGNDDAQVIDFIDRYYAAIERYHEDQCQGLIKSSVAPPESLIKRFAAHSEQAKTYLYALDVEEDDRSFVRRYRAARSSLNHIEHSHYWLGRDSWIDTIVEVEQLMVMFRHRHARSVERIIGRRVGTGGSSGVSYLDKTTEMRIFTELSAVWTLLLPTRYLPDLKEGIGLSNQPV